MRLLGLAVAFAAGLAIALASAWGLKKSPEPSLTTAEVEGVVARYLEKHPDAVIAAIRSYQAKAEKAEADDQKQALASRWKELAEQPGDPVIGNPDGDVTLVQFFDYRCGYCRRAYPDLVALQESDPKLRIVMKEFPILGPESVVAARASLAADRQGKYAAFHDALMLAEGPMIAPLILDVAVEAGLDVEQLQRDMESPEVKAALERNHKLAQQLGIKGTPVFLSRNEIIPGAAGADALRAMVAAVRKGSG